MSDENGGVLTSLSKNIKIGSILVVVVTAVATYFINQFTPPGAFPVEFVIVESSPGTFQINGVLHEKKQTLLTVVYRTSWNDNNPKTIFVMPDLNGRFLDTFPCKAKSFIIYMIIERVETYEDKINKPDSPVLRIKNGQVIRDRIK